MYSLNKNVNTSFHAWISAFLQRRTLKAPDQRPLYEYQVSNDEYSDLKRLLVLLGKKTNFAKDKAASACFVLYSAEWYRREYIRDNGWSWDPIWTSLSITLSASELSRVIPKGIEDFWGRPIRFYESERRNFLGSVFSEGGLPFRVLQESDSRFQLLFSRVLKEYEAAQMLGHSSRYLVSHLLEHSSLPQVFSEETSVELIARMADELFSIVQLYSLANSDEPLSILDKANSGWRNRFPIPLDEETGKEFLNGLLLSASKETKKGQNSKNLLGCQHYINDQNLSILKTRISLPKEAVFSLVSEPATSRFELVILEGNQQLVSLGPGYASIDGNIAKVRLRHNITECIRRDPREKLFLIALSGGAELARIAIENSSVSVGDIPLVFEQDDHHWQFTGEASVKTKSEDVLLILPPLAEVSFEGGEYSDLDPHLENRALRIKGKCKITVSADDMFVIHTGEISSNNLLLDLESDTLPWVSIPSLTYLGLPKLKWLNSDTTLSEKGADIYLSGKRLESCSLNQKYGRHYLSVRNRDNETLLRKRVGILPSDFKVEVKGTSQSNEGSLLFYSKTPCLYQVETQGIKSTRIRHDDHIELLLSSQGLPPSRISVKVTPNLECEPVTIYFPYPSSGYLAFDSQENSLPRVLSIHDLLGARIHLFGRVGQSFTNYQFELSLTGVGANNSRVSWYVQVSKNPVEISLFNLKEQIESLLSLKADIDQLVELTINNDFVCRIGRYSLDISYDRSRQMLISSDKICKKGILPEPVLMLLSEPERHPIELYSRKSEGVALGDFEIPNAVEKNGPWLIVPKVNSPVPFRPIFIAGNFDKPAASTEVKTLQKAVVIFDPGSSFNSFDPVLTAMASDPGHSGWQFLRSLYDRYGYLPLTTFQVWKALVQNQSALAMAMFKFEMSVNFLTRIESEFPFLWELFPVEVIKEAGIRQADFLRSKGINEETVSMVIDKTYSRLGNVVHSFGEGVGRWLSKDEFPQEIQKTKANLESTIAWLYQPLIRARSNDNWPSFGGSRLKRWANTSTMHLMSVEPEIDFRNAVFYLPAFMACVSANKIKLSDVFSDTADAAFFLRQVRDFDSNWFNTVYQFSLLYVLKSDRKDSL